MRERAPSPAIEFGGSADERSRRTVDDYWSSRVPSPKKSGLKALIRAHTSMRVCGRPVRRAGEALLIEIRRRCHGEAFRRAISIGAGTAAAEMDLLSAGIVAHFDIFEFASERMRLARTRAEHLGLDDRITFHHGDAFGQRHQPYDLVYWRNALHHMPDVRAVVGWSADTLVRNGLFVMSEYTGPNRLQYTDAQMAICDDALAMVPDSYFCLSDGTKISRKCVRPSKRALIKRDPSEAPDSESILPAVMDTFPEASVTNIGGLVYFAGLRRILHSFTEPRDKALIDSLLKTDARLADQGDSLFHAAFARKG
jgi:SAM-dependent methyltransferase